jgi:hypothetical protein
MPPFFISRDTVQSPHFKIGNKKGARGGSWPHPVRSGYWER